MYTLEDGTHDVIIEGTGVLDGGHSGFLDTPSGCCMGGIVTGPDLAAYTINVTDVTIRGLRIRNLPHWPIELDGVKGLLVDGVTMHDSGNSPGIGHGSEVVVVNNLRIYRIDDVCFSFYRGVENAVMSNSIVNQCGGGGISVYSDHPACVDPPQFSKNVVINNSIAYGQNTQSFDINGIGTEGEVSESAPLTFNLAHSHATQGFGVTPGRHVLVAGNVRNSQGFTPEVNYPAGIQLEGAQGVLVSSSSIFDEGKFTDTGWGIYAKHRTATAAIPLNICDNDSVPALPAMTLARTSILDNYVFNSTSPPNILSALRSDVPLVLVVAGNTYAPTGSVADDFIYGTGSHNADNDDQPQRRALPSERSRRRCGRRLLAGSSSSPPRRVPRRGVCDPACQLADHPGRSPRSIASIGSTAAQHSAALGAGPNTASRTSATSLPTSATMRIRSSGVTPKRVAQ